MVKPDKQAGDDCRCITRRGLIGAGLGVAALTQVTHAFAQDAAPTIDQALGCTASIAAVLAAHEHDDFFLGTSYGNTGPNSGDGAMSTWDSRYPNGDPKPGVGGYMNCAGFVSYVVQAAGGDVSGLAVWRSSQTGANPTTRATTPMRVSGTTGRSTTASRHTASRPRSRCSPRACS